MTVHPSHSIPEVELPGVHLRILAGTAYGASSLVRTFSPLFYVEARMSAGSELTLPEEYTDRAAYLVEGHVRPGGERSDRSRMLVFQPGSQGTLFAPTDSKLMLIGGEPFEEGRHIWWNFVSSSKERIEQAKRDWKEGRFPKIPGDDAESIPLPES